jgi:mannose-1-phosphate guanylyltransferase
VRAAIEAAQRDLDFVRLDRDAFTRVPGDSIDYAVMERTREAAVVEARFAWSDVGSWNELWSIGKKDANGNVTHGDVLLSGTTNSYVRSEGRLIAAVGAADMVIVETADAVLVARKEQADELKRLVKA